MTGHAKTVSTYCGSAGAVAASLAALCCAGLPILVSALAAAGLSFLRTDAVLVPAIVIALLVAVFGFWKGRVIYGSSGPLLLALLAAIVMMLGVIPLHGGVAKTAIGVGAIGLLAATFWNARLVRTCHTPMNGT